MDEMDIENVDDLNELEARLYAQIHHEPSGDCDLPTTYEEPLPARRVTSTSINNTIIDRTRGRYWNEKQNFRNRNSAWTKSNFDSVDGEQSEKQKQSGSGESGEIQERPVETADKTFQPPVKNLSNLRVNPFASGNDPKTKGSSSQSRGRKNEHVNQFKKLDLKATNKGLFGRQQNKLANAVKYDVKKQKAQAARDKMKKKQPSRTIELLSESDTDDVIEVRVPSPVIVALDTSSDEGDQNLKDETKSFIKPETILAKENNSSRCASPCSVISDDFIGHKDRSRLLEESVRADDEDLLLLENDVDSLMETPEKTDKTAASFAKPSQNKPGNTSNDYTVTHSDFRALDVYESESDIQESVYSKGFKKSKPSVVVNLEHESSSDEVEEIDITQKTKRLRKRRSSSANKDTDVYIDSTDSEQEKESEAQRALDVHLTKVTHIAFGEAIEKMVTPEEQLSKQTTVDTSDNEFIANLNTLAQGASSVTAPAENDSDEEEEITARSIAESVLNKSRAPEKPATPKNTITKKTVNSQPAATDNEEANDAIPRDSLSNLNDIFNKIDNMDKRVQDVESVDSDQSVELVAPLPISRINKPSQRKSKLQLQKEICDPVYNVVYSENSINLGGGGLGWNEEMRKFYNESWKGERFSVKNICSQMKPTKTLWKIYTDDRFPKYRKYSHQKCMNCCEFGHIRSKCPKPRKIPVCYMCGEKGHSEPRCPNTICLRCGNKTRMYTKSCNACNYQNRLICPICKVRGHSINLCPDKWRRYHSTTKPNQYPNNKVEYKNKKLCCICGLRGHLGEHCRGAIHFSEYPMFISEIRSHQKSYDDISIKTIRSGIGYNLMYEPDENISFELAENTTRQQYYGRFLLAVGMGYLLSRKRKNEDKENDETGEIQKKSNMKLKEYVVNPFAKTALEKSPSKAEIKEIETKQPAATDESISIDEFSSKDQAEEYRIMEVDEDAYAIEPSTSKGINPTPQENTVPEKIGSSSDTTDKNDSTPSTTPKTTCKENTNVNSKPHEHQSDSPVCREMDALPDFIPINEGESEDEEAEEITSAGISKKFVSVDTDEEEGNTNELPDLPCDAKIYLTTFHSKFLLSPNGNTFLVEKSKLFDIKSRLEWTSVGHILVIYGLRCNQEKFHIELIHKFRELSEQMNRSQLEKSQKIPRKTEVLIRFLRENINQLLTPLGNPNELLKRLSYQEKQQTKTSWKSAEKTRRLLNMILIGQAGLLNGSKHLDDLLTSLRVLIDECKEETVSNEMRDEIDSHWRLIFSSYRHNKYSQLVDAYNQLPCKNRLQNLNIDPRLLGKKILDTSLTKVQKDRMDKAICVNTSSVSAGSDKTYSPGKLVPNPLSVRTPKRTSKTLVSEKKRPKTPAKEKLLNSQSQSQAMNQSTVSGTIHTVNVELEKKCAHLLNEIDEKGQKEIRIRPNTNSKESSMFWSREAMSFIDECMDLGKSNQSFLEKLSRVQIKSQKGLLSYNDYRAIIKIHNVLKGKH